MQFVCTSSEHSEREVHMYCIQAVVPLDPRLVQSYSVQYKMEAFLSGPVWLLRANSGTEHIPDVKE